MAWRRPIDKRRYERRRRIILAYLSGAPAEEVARRFGITRNTLFVNLHRWGVTLPPEERERRRSETARRSVPARAEAMRGKERVWPDCPDHLRADYETLSWYMPKRDARASLEAQERLRASP